MSVENKYQNLRIPLKMEDEIQNKGGGTKEPRWQKRVKEIQSRNALHNYPECKYLICGMGQDRREGGVGMEGGEYETKVLIIWRWAPASWVFPSPGWEQQAAATVSSISPADWLSSARHASSPATLPTSPWGGYDQERDYSEDISLNDTSQNKKANPYLRGKRTVFK